MSTPKDSDAQKMGELAAPSTPGNFPDLQDASLSRVSEDQQALMRIQDAWNEHGDTWSSEMKEKILHHLPDVQTTEINKDTPSKHKLYAVEFDFASWVLLRCIYPDQALPILKALIVAKHPDIQPDSFAGPDLAKMRKPAKKSCQQKKDAVAASHNTGLSEAQLAFDEKRRAAGPRRCEPSRGPYPRLPMHYVYDVIFFIRKTKAQIQEAIFLIKKSLKSKLSKVINKYKYINLKNPKGMAGGHAASEKTPMMDVKFLESLESGSLVNDSAPGLSGKQSQELKDYTGKMAVADHLLVNEMHGISVVTGRKIKFMMADIKSDLAKAKKQQKALESEVAELHAMIKALRRESKVLHELKAKTTSLDK
ncbi:Ff.00g075570.m01.CDS01 [Fusarium sp. VM40]|nr:Ff.00g075570.m01.CDS01 [Fusarium sp. VM40]